MIIAVIFSWLFKCLKQDGAELNDNSRADIHYAGKLRSNSASYNQLIQGEPEAAKMPVTGNDSHQGAMSKNLVPPTWKLAIINDYSIFFKIKS